MGPFLLIDPNPLETQQDGRRFALEVIRQIRDAGKIHCSAHPEEQDGEQCGAVLAALVKLEREGTSQARSGFAVVLCDLLGRALDRTLVPEAFEERESRGEFLRWHWGIPGETSPRPEGRETPESVGDCRPLSPDRDPAKRAR